MGRKPETPERKARKRQDVWEALVALGGPGNATKAQVAESMGWRLRTVERYWPLAEEAPLFATTVSLPDAARAERMAEALDRGLRDAWAESAPLFATTVLQEPQGRPVVFEKLPRPARGRWIAVGRLDINTSGLLILTTDGELANRLMHPSLQVEREYAVRVFGEVSDDQLSRLVNGIELEDGPARFEEITPSGGEGMNRWYHVVIMEGRKREVRRLWESVGLQVSRLKRVRYGPVILDSSVKAGRWRALSVEERKTLLELAGLKDDAPVAAAPSKGRKPVRRGRPGMRRT